MASMTRWDPYGDMVSLRDVMDQLFENALVGFGSGSSTGRQGWQVPIDVTENDDSYVVEAALPGINPDDLNITVQENVLTISGEAKQQQDKQEQRYHMRERRWGNFSRSISLPMSVNASEVKAEYTDGVLKLTLPKSEEAKPKRIQVKTGSGQKTIEGQSQHVQQDQSHKR
jgi:HSP20 family protein